MEYVSYADGKISSVKLLNVVVNVKHLQRFLEFLFWLQKFILLIFQFLILKKKKESCQKMMK
jgi:hypothetical protein